MGKAQAIRKSEPVLFAPLLTPRLNVLWATRAVVADAIEKDPVKWDEAILG